MVLLMCPSFLIRMLFFAGRKRPHCRGFQHKQSKSLTATYALTCKHATYHGQQSHYSNTVILAIAKKSRWSEYIHFHFCLLCRYVTVMKKLADRTAKQSAMLNTNLMTQAFQASWAGNKICGFLTKRCCHKNVVLMPILVQQAHDLM